MNPKRRNLPNMKGFISFLNRFKVPLFTQSQKNGTVSTNGEYWDVPRVRTILNGISVITLFGKGNSAEGGDIPLRSLHSRSQRFQFLRRERENKKIIISKFLAIILSSPRISIFSSSQPSADFSMLLVICDSRSFFYLAIESLHFCGFDYWFLIHRLRFVSIGLFDAEISILSFLRIQSMIFELFDI